MLVDRIYLLIVETMDKTKESGCKMIELGTDWSESICGGEASSSFAAADADFLEVGSELCRLIGMSYSYDPLLHLVTH